MHTTYQCTISKTTLKRIKHTITRSYRPTFSSCFVTMIIEIALSRLRQHHGQYGCNEDGHSADSGWNEPGKFTLRQYWSNLLRHIYSYFFIYQEVNNKRSRHWTNVGHRWAGTKCWSTDFRWKQFSSVQCYYGVDRADAKPTKHGHKYNPVVCVWCEKINVLEVR